MFRRIYLVVPLAILVALGATLSCSDDASSQCVEVDLNCSPLYTPTFDKVFEMTLNRSCTLTGTACHSAQGAKANLVFENIETSHGHLTTGDNPIANPNDIACSPLVYRLATEMGADLMPPGSRLADEEICSVVKWVAEGAKR